EIVELRPPIESRGDARYVRDQHDRVAWPAAGRLERNVAPAGPPHRRDDLQHRSAATIAAIERCAGAAVTQVSECRRMRASEIAHVDIVADTGAVGSGIVGAVDLQLRALAECYLARDFDQMRRLRGGLTGAP